MTRAGRGALRVAAVVVALSATTALRAEPASTAPAIEPAAMIALADGDPRRSHEGLYRMTVRSAAKPGRITFLNSEADYRAAGDVSFTLSPSVAAELAKRLGGPAHAALIGKTVTVSGILTRAPIVNTLNQRAHSFNRWSYQVRVERVDQVRAIAG